MGLNGITMPASIAVYLPEQYGIETHLTKLAVSSAGHDIMPNSSIAIALQLFLVAIALVVSLEIIIGFVSTIARAVLQCLQLQVK